MNADEWNKAWPVGTLVDVAGCAHVYTGRTLAPAIVRRSGFVTVSVEPLTDDAFARYGKQQDVLLVMLRPIGAEKGT